MLSKIEHGHRPPPLDPISDLITFLNKTLKIDYMIAGGYPRDWYADSPYNDIDIFLDISNTYIKDSDTLVRMLKSSKRFDISREIENRFVEAIFCEKAPFSKGRPKYRVQFILWSLTYLDAISSFDFEHCKFFIPIINQDPRGNFLGRNFISGEVYSYTEALEGLNQKQLIFSEAMIKKLESTMSDKLKGTPTLEILIKRTLRFISRGYDPSLQSKDILFENVEKHFSEITISSVPGVRSILLDEAEDYDDVIRLGNSIYKETEVVKNLIANLLLIYTTEERTKFLLSPCKTLRDITLQLFQEFPELKNGI